MSRLIDADELLKHKTDHEYISTHLIYNAPTVIDIGDGAYTKIKALKERDELLDKIRAEIEQITDTMGVSYNQYVNKIDVLQIIDKYRAKFASVAFKIVEKEANDG